ncbi:Nn.00g030240.m01.CDS01 [Neocucurbitaria sp. VM-36]
MPSLTLTPLSSLRLSAHYIPSHAHLPNTTPHNHPLLIYHSAFPPSTSPSTLESHLPTNAITPQWRYTMYSTTHYHSTTHEVLCIFAGRAKLLFGGEENPSRVETEVGAGDAILVPAGVGHRLLEELGGGEFEMVGGYPRGCGWDMCYGVEGEEEKARSVGRVEWVARDPLYGEGGPAVWGREELEKRGIVKREVQG